jgi:hypothetical protein
MLKFGRVTTTEKGGKEQEKEMIIGGVDHA